MPHPLEYVITRALLQCSQGTVPMPFKATPRTTKIAGLLAANAADKVPLVNIPSFVICKKLTQLAGGTPTPCVPAPTLWQDTYPAKVGGADALLCRSCITCPVGQGKIEFLTSGQLPLPPAVSQELKDVQQGAREALEEVNAEKASVGEASLAEGFIPVWGSGRDLIHAVQTGNKLGVVMNLGFLIWDVASVAAGVVSFGTATAGMMAGKAGLRAALKAGSRVAVEMVSKKLASTAAKALALKEGLPAALKAFAKKVPKLCVTACFPAGTPVAVADGFKNIEDIGAGELVWSWHEETGDLALKPVTQTLRREADALVELQIGADTVRATPEHPFWADGAWKMAGELEVGDELRRSDGQTMPVRAVTHHTAEPTSVFNLEVADWHTYLVSWWMFVVHNATICLAEIKRLLLARRYMREVETLTKLKVHPKQLVELKKAIKSKKYAKLSVDETAKSRKEFNKVKNSLIEKWEKETGQTWPKYNKDVLSKKGVPYIKKGDKYDAHHLIENTHGGEHEWWNIHPAKNPDIHQGGIHGKDGLSRILFGD